MVGNRLVVVARRVVGNAPLVVHLGVCRVEPDGFSVVGNCLFVVVLGSVGKAPVVIRFGIALVKSNGLSVFGNRLVVVAFFVGGQTAGENILGTRLTKLCSVLQTASDQRVVTSD